MNQPAGIGYANQLSDFWRCLKNDQSKITDNYFRVAYQIEVAIPGLILLAN
jgi:hypothetical protein